MQNDMQNLLNFFEMHHFSNSLKPVSISPQEPPISEQQYEGLNQQLKNLYDTIFNKEKKDVNLANTLSLKHKKTLMPVCNKILSEAQPVFRCFDCSAHPASVFCISCFENGDHSNHRYQKFPAGGGNCDCGNPIAIKKQGFCKNHTGQAKLADPISEAEKGQFTQIMMSLISWKVKRQMNILSIIIFDYLAALNQQSIYYNVLTYKLFMNKLPKSFNPQQSNSTILDFLLALSSSIHEKAVKAINSVFFNMFSLEDFKLDLMKAFMHAYNTVVDFQDTQFHSLFIQLFANDILVQKLCEDKSFTFCPQKKFKLRKLLNDLYFLSSIGSNAAIKFFRNYFQANKVINLPFMSEIEAGLEKKEENPMHMVDVVSNSLAEEHMFYETLQEINKTYCKSGQHEQIRLLLRNTYQFIPTCYSYHNNKAILPYHRSLSSHLFLQYNGNIKNMQLISQLTNLCQILKVTPSEFLMSMQKNLKKVLLCLLEFAETFVKNTYFENYLIIYVLKGKMVINLDMLFVKQCFALFTPQHSMINEELPKEIIDTKSSISIPTILIEILKDTLNEKTSLSKEECALLWINFLGVVIEAIISKIPQIQQNEALDLQNKEILNQKKLLFKKLIKSAGSVTRDEMKPWQKVFLAGMKDQELEQSASFDKLNRKYNLIEDENVTPIDLDYYPSKLKSMSFNLNKSKQQEVKPANITLFETTLLSQAFNRQILLFVLKKIIEGVQQIDHMQMICEKYSKLLEKLRMISEQKLEQFKDEFEKLSDFRAGILQVEEELRNFQKSIKNENEMKKENSEEEERKRLKQLANSKKSRIKKKFEEKSKKILSENIKIIKEEQSEDQKIMNQNVQQKICMICRDPTEQDCIYYMSNFETVNFLNHKIQLTENLFSFKSCLHSAHYQCFYKLYGKKQTFKCPLCKQESNLMIPVSGKAKSNWEQSEGQMLSRVDFMNNTRNPTPEITHTPFPSINNISVFWNILKSFSHSIGVFGLLNPATFEKKTKYVTNSLYTLIHRFWNSNISAQNQLIMQEIFSEYKGIHQQLQKKNSQYSGLFQIKMCCIEVIFQSLIHPFSPQYMIDRYSLMIEINDLKQLIKNIFFTINPNQQPLLPEMIDLQETSGPIKTLRDHLFNYFVPPLEAQVLFQLRKQKAKLCKGGHDILVCIICKEFFCYECKKADAHTNEVHAGLGLFLSLLNGEYLLMAHRTKIKTKSLYENRIGGSWTQEREPSAFKLNKQLYDHIVEMFFRQELVEFLKQNMKDDIQIIQAMFFQAQ